MAKIYLFSGFILIGLAIAAFMFYFIFYNVHLTNRNHELVELKEKECFGEKGINLAITDFSIFHQNTLDLTKFCMWSFTYIRCKKIKWRRGGGGDYKYFLETILGIPKAHV